MMLLALSLLCLKFHLSNGDQYCATISASEASGASGYYALQIQNGAAEHVFSLDLSKYTGSTYCPLSTQYGLAYRLHSYWVSTQQSAAAQLCTHTFTGGTYDPFYACSPSSSNINTACTLMKMSYAKGYIYYCNATTFSTGQYTNCELGDISGKFGQVYSTQGDGVFTGGPFADYFPPQVSDYRSGDELWASIVFHCGYGNQPIACASLSSKNLSPCFSGFAAMSFSALNANQSPTTDYSKAAFTLSVALSILSSMSLGFVIGGVIMYCIRK